ncbi:MAG: hypothetical protein K9K82_04275 [Desulfobacteraceae bacterium]|nr:hypothetical protein [Desulfobacteraceae bacterium]
MKNADVQITDRIESRFKDGIRLGGGIIHYIESVTGAAGANELFCQLKDSESCETQSLYELIFFPAEEDQIDLEPALESETVDQKDIQAIERRLCSKQIRTRLIYPDGSKTPQIRIPENVLHGYIQRLNLARQIPEKLAETVNACITGSLAALQVRVRLRNTKFDFRENIVSFLCSYLEQIPLESQEDMEELTWVLDFLDQTGAQTGIYTALMEEKQRTAEMLRQAADSDRRLERQPVEMLIMQGVSIPCISSDQALKRIGLIDRIALSIFGKTESAEQHSPIDLGVFNARNDMDKVIKILS